MPANPTPPVDLEALSAAYAAATMSVPAGTSCEWSGCADTAAHVRRTDDGEVVYVCELHDARGDCKNMWHLDDSASAAVLAMVPALLAEVRALRAVAEAAKGESWERARDAADNLNGLSCALLLPLASSIGVGKPLTLGVFVGDEKVAEFDGEEFCQDLASVCHVLCREGADDAD